LDIEYRILQAEIHLPPRVKYDNCCTDFQKSHIWQLLENRTYPELHKNL